MDLKHLSDVLMFARQAAELVAILMAGIAATRWGKKHKIEEKQKLLLSFTSVANEAVAAVEQLHRKSGAGGPIKKDEAIAIGLKLAVETGLVPGKYKKVPALLEDLIESAVWRRNSYKTAVVPPEDTAEGGAK